MIRLNSNARIQKSPSTARFHRQVIEFLIRLCETDPVALAASEQPGDLLNLAYGFYRFGLTMARDDLGESPTDSASRLASDIRADPAKHLQSIIRALSALLGAAVDGKTFEWVVQPKTKLLFRGSRNAQKAILFTPEGPHSLEQSVIFGAVQCLDGEEGRMVRRCRREVCRRIFLARRPKQIFCTRQCASAAAFERYKRERGEEVYRAEHRRTARASWRTKQRRLGRSVTPRIKDAAKSKGV